MSKYYNISDPYFGLPRLTEIKSEDVKNIYANIYSNIFKTSELKFITVNLSLPTKKIYICA